MTIFRRLAIILSVSLGLASCATTEGLSAAGDVHALLVSIRDNDRAAFDDYAQAIQRVGLRNGGRYVSLSTSTTIEEAVFGPIVRAGGIQ